MATTAALSQNLRFAHWYPELLLQGLTPEQTRLIGRLKGYHGVTVATASLTGLPNNHLDFDLPIQNILHTSCPHHYRFGLPDETEEEFATRMANDLEELIGSVAAEANHEPNRRRQHRLDAAFNALTEAAQTLYG